MYWAAVEETIRGSARHVVLQSVRHDVTGHLRQRTSIAGLPWRQSQQQQQWQRVSAVAGAWPRSRAVLGRPADADGRRLPPRVSSLPVRLLRGALRRSSAAVRRRVRPGNAMLGCCSAHARRQGIAIYTAFLLTASKFVNTSIKELSA